MLCKYFYDGLLGRIFLMHVPECATVVQQSNHQTGPIKPSKRNAGPKQAHDGDGLDLWDIRIRFEDKIVENVKSCSRLPTFKHQEFETKTRGCCFFSTAADAAHARATPNPPTAAAADRPKPRRHCVGKCPANTGRVAVAGGDRAAATAGAADDDHQGDAGAVRAVEPRAPDGGRLLGRRAGPRLRGRLGGRVRARGHRLRRRRLGGGVQRRRHAPGVGVGLPQHGIIKNHYHGGFASNTPFESARFYTLTIIKGMLWDAISYVSHVAAMRKESRQKLLRFHQENPPVSGGVDLPKLGKGVSSSVRSTMDCIKAFTNQRWPP